MDLACKKSNHQISTDNAYISMEKITQTNVFECKNYIGK